mmetsp:Transcript_16475/g.41082  ORF Transcript_16475/g.41082 Transcript_16475/m.41082 type:complete len:274 (-) Transcript_16475:157-978(-)
MPSVRMTSLACRCSTPCTVMDVVMFSSSSISSLMASMMTCLLRQLAANFLPPCLPGRTDSCDSTSSACACACWGAGAGVAAWRMGSRPLPPSISASRSSPEMPTSSRLDSDSAREAMNSWRLAPLKLPAAAPGTLSCCASNPGPPGCALASLPAVLAFPDAAAAASSASARSACAASSSLCASSRMMCSTRRTMLPMASSTGFAAWILYPTDLTSSMSAAASGCLCMVTRTRMISAVRLAHGSEPLICLRRRAVQYSSTASATLIFSPLILLP